MARHLRLHPARGPTRAEAAIRDLYRRAGEQPPAFLWVASPEAGTIAYALARQAHGRLAPRFAPPGFPDAWPPDLNPGGGRLSIDTEWAMRLLRRALAMLPDDLRARVANTGTSDPATLAWSIGRAVRLGDGGTATRLLQIEASEGRLVPDALTAAGRVGNAGAAALDVAAAGALGAGWDRILAITGADLARDLYRRATVALVEEVAGGWRAYREASQAMRPGQFDALTPALALVREVGGRPLWKTLLTRDAHDALIDRRIELARSAGPWWALPDLAIVSERPSTVRRDDRARLHSATGPALAFADGTRLWAWHGVRVPEDIIERPEAITVERIDAERNAEVRRAMIERFGEERFVRADGGEVVSSDETGRLWRRRTSRPSRPWVQGPQQDEPVVMVEVRNATPEPDGTRRTYFLRVPPTMQTAREAVAWTFGMTADDWRPAAES